MFAWRNHLDRAEEALVGKDFFASKDESSSVIIIYLKG